MAGRTRPRPAGRGTGPARPAARSPHGERRTDHLVREMMERREQVMRGVVQLRRSWMRVHDWDKQLTEAQAALSRAHVRFVEFYDFVPVPFLVLDDRLRIVELNEPASAFLAPARFAGLPFVGFVAPADIDRFLSHLSGLKLSSVTKLELGLRSRGGIVPVQLTAKVREHHVRDAPTERVTYVSLLDLSEVRRLEEEQKRSAAAEQAALATSRAKDEFIAMVSHELRTPLAPILNSAEALAGAGLEGALGEAAAMIRRNVLVEARLIDDLLDAARVTQKLLSIEHQPLSLHELVRREARDRQPEFDRARLSLRLELEARNDAFEGDAGRMAQVLRNLLVNAAKFTPPGGGVTVRTSDAAGILRVSVTDTGQGMSPAELERVFEPFQSGRPAQIGRDGLGLGLAISRGIVEAHGGGIRARSEGPGRGSTIEIDLPFASVPVRAKEPEKPAPSPPPARAPAPPRGGKPARAPKGIRVLIVEDHADSAETLAVLLQLEGYGVTVAHSMRQAEGLAQDCDVLISDIGLPDGSGLDLIRNLRRERPLPAIALSGFGTEQDSRRSREAGFAEHLTKPVYADKLLAALQRIAPAASA
jgi:signal transduction histidine kinase